MRPNEISAGTIVQTPSQNGEVWGGASHDSVPAADAAALAMIGLMFFLFTCIGFWARGLYKRTRYAKPDPIVELKSWDNSPSNKSAPWERPTDW